MEGVRDDQARRKIIVRWGCFPKSRFSPVLNKLFTCFTFKNVKEHGKSSLLTMEMYCIFLGFLAIFTAT